MSDTNKEWLIIDISKLGIRLKPNCKTCDGSGFLITITVDTEGLKGSCRPCPECYIGIGFVPR
jgi:hypothetical protein